MSLTEAIRHGFRRVWARGLGPGDICVVDRQGDPVVVKGGLEPQLQKIITADGERWKLAGSAVTSLPPTGGDEVILIDDGSEVEVRPKLSLTPFVFGGNATSGRYLEPNASPGEGLNTVSNYSTKLVMPLPTATLDRVSFIFTSGDHIDIEILKGGSSVLRLNSKHENFGIFDMGSAGMGVSASQGDIFEVKTNVTLSTCQVALYFRDTTGIGFVVPFGSQISAQNDYWRVFSPANGVRTSSLVTANKAIIPWSCVPVAVSQVVQLGTANPSTLDIVIGSDTFSFDFPTSSGGTGVASINLAETSVSRGSQITAQYVGASVDAPSQCAGWLYCRLDKDGDGDTRNIVRTGFLWQWAVDVASAYAGRNFVPFSEPQGLGPVAFPFVFPGLLSRGEDRGRIVDLFAVTETGNPSTVTVSNTREAFLDELDAPTSLSQLQQRQDPVGLRDYGFSQNDDEDGSSGESTGFVYITPHDDENDVMAYGWIE